MKKLNQFIIEKFRLSKDCLKQVKYNYQPETTDELKKLVKKLIEERGIDADLNDIDTSKITSMSFLFMESKFNGDISQWDVSNVEKMGSMFCNSKFNGDISNWNVSNVKNMQFMFAYSNFNGDISEWDVSNVTNMEGIFDESPLAKNPPAWYKK